MNQRTTITGSAAHRRRRAARAALAGRPSQRSASTRAGHEADAALVAALTRTMTAPVADPDTVSSAMTRIADAETQRAYLAALRSVDRLLADERRGSELVTTSGRFARRRG